MPPLLEGLGNFIIAHYEWRHFLIAAGMFIQWEVTLVLSMYLIVNGFLGWGGFIVAVALGTAAYESLLYWFGRLLGDTKFGAFIRRKIPHHDRLEHILQAHSNTLLFLSKFVAYLNSASVVLSGWIRMPFRKFVKIRSLANVFWFLVLGTITYFFVSGYKLLDHEKIFRNFELAAIGVTILVIIGSKRIAKKFLWQKTLAEEKLEKIEGKTGKT